MSEKTPGYKRYDANNKDPSSHTDGEVKPAGYSYLPVYPDTSAINDPEMRDRAQKITVLSQSLIVIDSWRRHYEQVPEQLADRDTFKQQEGQLTFLIAPSLLLSTREINALTSQTCNAYPAQQELLEEAQSHLDQLVTDTHSTSDSAATAGNEAFAKVWPIIEHLQASDISVVAEPKKYLERLQLFSSILHDIKNDIQALSSNHLLAARAVFARTPTTVPIKLNEHVGQLLAGLKTRMEMVQYLVEKQGELEPVGISDFKSKTQELLQQEGSVYSMDIKHEDNIPAYTKSDRKISVQGPLIFLQALVKNIVQNTRDEIATVGEIRPTTLTCTLEQDENYVDLRFEDNGPGFPDDILMNGFHPCVSTHQGSGIGMHLITEMLTGYFNGHYKLGNIIEDGKVTGAVQTYSFRLIDE